MAFLLLPIVTYAITSVISDNIALSLGMVGALSIVRFRNPVRSPFELSVYFLLISLGICASVSLKVHSASCFIVSANARSGIAGKVATFDMERRNIQTIIF